MTLTLIQILTFIAGFATGLTAMLLTIIWRDNRRFARQAANRPIANPYAGMAQGSQRGAPPTNPTELDQ